MDSEKSINSFNTKEMMGYRIHYWEINFNQLISNVLTLLLLCKINVLDILNKIDSIQIFVYSEVLKFLSKQTFYRECRGERGKTGPLGNYAENI